MLPITISVTRRKKNETNGKDNQTIFDTFSEKQPPNDGDMEKYDYLCRKLAYATNMNYYSTNHQAPVADLRKAVVKGLAEDRGLYMPEEIHHLPKAFFDDFSKMRFQDIAYNVASAFFGEDVDLDGLQNLVYDTLSFDCPIVKVKENIYSLELFHGPTLAFKDVGARFMARLLQYYIREERRGMTDDFSTEGAQERENKLVNVLVATSGDTG